MGLLNGIGIGFPFFHGGVAREVTDYLARVAADSGTVDDVEALKDLVEFYKRQGTLDLTQLFAAPFLGSKVRTSGIYKYLSKLYSVELPANDLAQTTELNQPYQSGNIAPNEVLSMSNPNGDERYLTHPAISFAANQAWSVTVVFNVNVSSSSASPGTGILGNLSDQTTVSVTQAPQLRLRNESADEVYLSNVQRLIGKNRVLTLVANGDGKISVYIDGVFFSSPSIISNFSFNRIMAGRGGNFNGAAHFYRIQSGAITATQVLAEYNKLRTYIPEIETVQIGSKYITSSNFQAVATPAGNVIENVTANGAVEKVINGGFEAVKVNIDDDGMVSNIVFDGTLGSNVLELVQSAASTGGAGKRTVWNAPTGLTESLGNSSGKWVKISFKAISISGNTSLFVGNTIGLGVIKTITTSWVTYTGYYKQSTSGASVMVYLNGAGTFRIDDLKFEVLNWSNATEIYDAVYAATSGTTAQKEYAALKEAAMWCSYDNSTANQAIYGKFYNDYAIQLLKTDMAAQNFGYHIPTEAEIASILATYTDANDLKKEGTNYWDNALGTNASGLTLLGTGCRMPDGSFASIKKVGGFATSDGNVSKQLGLPIRLIRD